VASIYLDACCFIYLVEGDRSGGRSSNNGCATLLSAAYTDSERHDGQGRALVNCVRLCASLCQRRKGPRTFVEENGSFAYLHFCK